MTGDHRPPDPANQLSQRLDPDFALQAAGLGVWELNPATGQVIWDDRCRELFGLARENDLPYEQAMRYIHPDDVDRVRQSVQWAMNPQSDGIYDQTYRTIGGDDGQLRWVRFHGQGYFNEAGEVYRLAGVAQEVTQQALAQQVLHQRQARQSFLLRLSDSLRSLTDPLAVYYETACLLGEYLGASRVGYAEAQGTGDAFVVLRNYVNGVADLQGCNLYADYGRLPAELLTGRTVVRPDIAEDSTLSQAEKEACRILEQGATVDKPLLRHGRLMAVLFIHDKEAHPWSTDELSLVDEVAERLMMAVDQARAEEALRQSEQRFRLLADSVPQAIWVTDAEGNAEFLNRWWTDYSGIPYQASTAWQIAADILHPADGPVLIAAFQEAMRTGTGFEVEQRNRSASGEYRWFLNKGEPYRDPQTGLITKWVGCGVDIHDRKLAEQSRQESEARYRALSVELEEQVHRRTMELAATNQEYAAMNEELEEANSLLIRSNDNLQKFAYVASHDLQEPLRKIQQFADLLKMRYATTTGEEFGYLDRMQSAASRMSTLIRDLLDFSRISTQRDASGPVALDEVITQVLLTLEVPIRETGAQLRLEPLPTVVGDASQLSQLFQNLLSNALKFSRVDRSGAVTVPQISVRAKLIQAAELPSSVKLARQVSVYHRVDVADNGVGFEEKYVDRIFQVFQRLHGRSEFAGTGIGLAICEKVAANHGGAITASSRPGQGATFSVYLPASQ